MGHLPLKESWRADLALLWNALVWGVTFSIIKEALQDVSPFLYNALRFTVATGCVGLLFHRQLRHIDRRTLGAGVLTGLCLGAGYGFQTLGLAHTTASKSAFITGFSVILVPFLMVSIERVTPRWTAALGAALAFLGLWFLTSAPGMGTLNAGDLLTLGCAVAFAFHIICVDLFTRRHAYVQLVFLQLLVATLANVPPIFLLEAPHMVPNMRVIGTILFTAVFCSALAFYIQNRVQRDTTPARTAIIFSMEPVFAALVAWGFYGEALGTLGIVGGACIVAGMLAAELGPLWARTIRRGNGSPLQRQPEV